MRLPRLSTALCLLLVMACAWLAGRRAIADSHLLPAWPDECIYLVGARNLAERGTLDTHFYLTHSLLRLGHPHRDVHLPGYIAVLAPVVKLRGATPAAAAELNHGLFVASAAAFFLVALRLLGERPLATAAALLFVVLPPLPAYLAVAYAEPLVAFGMLLPLAIAATAPSRMAAAVVAGLLFGAALGVRETLLLALPLHLVLFERRPLLRGFLPAAAAGVLLLVAPFAGRRAIHPNALFPSVLTDALATDSPVSALAAALWGNVTRNLATAAQARPFQDVEDLLLLFLAVLALGAVLGVRSLPAAGRRAGQATLASLALLLGAVLAVYVIRGRGGVLGGVRAFLPWAPLLLVVALAPLLRLRSRLAQAAIVTVIALGCVELDRRQIYFFNRYRASDHEDQERFARLLQRETDAARPHRVLARAFLYGYERWPVEVIWQLPRDARELRELERTVAFDVVAVHNKSADQRRLFGNNPNYRRLNRPDEEYIVWRRLQ